MKAVIEKVLNTYFGKWISGVDRENLHFNLLSGNFKVKDISLNRTYFDSLDIPLRVAFSHIGELNITAPLSKLGSVTCILSDVFLILKFKDQSAKNVNDVKLKRSIIEKYALSSLEQFMKKVNQEKDGIAKNLVKKLINNLELKIQNIHIRFQQQTQKTKFCFGITLKAITFLPTDQHWNIQKNQQSEESVSQTLYKKMKIQQLNIYWDQTPTLWGTKQPKQIIQLIKQTIQMPKNPLFHISTDVRLKIQNGQDETIPLYQVFVALNDLDLQLTKTQMQQMLIFFQRLTLHNELKLLMKNKNSTISQGYQETFQKYIKQLVLGQNHYNPQIQSIYEQVSAATLYEWVLEKVKAVVIEEKMEQQKKKKSGWFGWMKNSPNLEDLQQQIQWILKKDNTRDGKSPFCALQLKAPEGKLRISTVKNNVKSYIQFVYNQIQFIFNISSDNQSMSLNLSLNKIQLDLVQMHKELKNTSNILKTSQQKGELFGLTHSMTSSSSVIHKNTSVQISELVLTLKPEFYKRLKDILNFGDFQEDLKNTVFSKIYQLQVQKNPKQIKIEQKNHISVNIASPVIIIPYLGTAYYLLNIGTFALDSQNQKYNLIINDTSFLYYEDSADENQDYLINNMSVQIKCQFNSNNKNINIIIPKVNINIGLDDFIRLLQIYQYFSDSKAIKLKSLKNRRAFIEKNKQFQSKITLKSSSGGWKNDYLILSGYFIYIYQQQNSLQQYHVIPIKGLTYQIQQQDKLVFSRDHHRYVMKYNQLLNPILDIIKQKKIQLANERQLMQLFGNITHASQNTEQIFKFDLEIKIINVRYHTTHPILSIFIDNSLFSYIKEEKKSEAQYSYKYLFIDDLTHRYKSKQYEHFIIMKGEDVIQFKYQSQVLQQCTCQNIDVFIPIIDMNWKPQIFLELHSIFKEYQKYEQRIDDSSEEKKQSWMASLKKIQSDTQFMEVVDFYDTSQISIKQQKQKFLTVEEYQKYNHLLVFRKVNIKTSISISLFHRQTKIVLGKIQCQNMNIQIVQSAAAIFVKGSINDLLLYQVGDFENTKIEKNQSPYQNKPTHLILKKIASSQNIMKFHFSTFNTDEFTNKDRIINFIDLSFSGMQFHYYHQYTMRLFDYFFIQILCVILEPELVIANKNLLEQLNQGDFKQQIQILGQYNQIMKKFINPFFTDINITLKDLVIFLKAGQTQQTFFISNIKQISIHNNIKKEAKRFQKSQLHKLLHKYLWQQDYFIDIQGFSFNMLEEQVIKPIDLNLIYNRAVNTNLIKYLFKDIGTYDQISYVTGVIKNIQIDFSRWTYLNFIKFINFNVLYEDLLDHLYTHNYKITKLSKPQPILITIDIRRLNFIAKHDTHIIYDTKANDLTLSYHRTSILDKILTLIVRDLLINSQDHPVLKYSSDNKMSLQYKIENTNKRSINLSLDSPRMLVSCPNLLVILQWIKLQPWVDTVDTSFSPQMAITASIKNFYFALKSNFGSTIFVKGSINFQKFINQTSKSIEQIQQDFIDKKFKVQEFDQPISYTKIELSVELFRCTFENFLGQEIESIKKRNILNKTDIIITSRQLLKIQTINNAVEPSINTVIMILSASLDFSMTDIILFQNMLVDQKVPEETLQLIQKIKQSGHEVIQIQKQIFSSVVFTVNEAVFHFINNVGESFVPLFSAQINELHIKIKYNKQVIETIVSLNPMLTYYNIELMSWEPFLQNCQLLLQASIDIINNKKIVKLGLQNHLMVTVSRTFLKQLETIFKIFNSLEKDSEQFQTVEFSNSVIVTNFSGYPITINGNNIENQKQLKIKIPFEKNSTLDTLQIHYQNLNNLHQNILHSQSTKKYYLSKGQKQQYPLIINPIIKDFKKYIFIQGLYQIRMKNGDTKYLPFDQDLSNIQYNNAIFNLNEVEGKQINGSIFTIERSKKQVIFIQSQSHSITNCLPIPVSINEYVLQKQQTLGYINQLTISLPKQQYKLIGERHKYLTCESYIIVYDDIKIFQNSNKINGHEINDNKLQFVQVIFIIKNQSSKLQISRGNNKIQFNTNIGKNSIKLENDGRSFEYNVSTIAKTTSAGIQKVTTIVPKYVLINSCSKQLVIKQNTQTILPHMKRVIFNFSINNKTKQVIIRLQKFESKELILDLTNECIVLRDQSNNVKIVSIDIILSDDITFINFSEEVLYKIKNETEFDMSVYQQCNQDKKQYYFKAEKQEKPFGFDYSKQGSNVYIYLIAKELNTKKKYLIDIDDMLFDKELQIDGKFVYLNLGYADGFRVLKLTESSQSNCQAPPSMEIEVLIPSIGISIIGNENNVRKQLIFASITEITFKYQYSKQQLQIDLIVLQFNIQNSRNPLAKFKNIISSKKQPFLRLRFEQDMDSPKVIDYFGLSINQLAVSLSSTDISVLKANFEQFANSLMKTSNHQQNILDKQIDSSNRYFIDKLQIHPIKAIVSYKSQGTDNSLLKAFANIQEASLKANGVYLTNLSCRKLGQLTQKIVQTYKENIFSNILPLLGNIAILGRPASLLSKIGTGFKQFIQLPVQGFSKSPIEGGKGLTMGAKSLIQNTIEGTMNSVGGISQSLGSGIATLTLDEKYQKERQQILNRRSSNFIQGVIAGGQSLYKGIQSGVKGVFSQPLKGAKQKGASGFLIGSLKGITGLALKPISGVLDMTSKTFEGLKNQSQVLSNNPIPHHHFARVFYNQQRQYRIYDFHHSKLSQKLVLLDQQLKDLSWVSTHPLPANQILILTIEYIIIYHKDKNMISQKIQSKIVKNIEIQQQKIYLKTSSKLLQIKSKDVKKVSEDLNKIISHHEQK